MVSKKIYTAFEKIKEAYDLLEVNDFSISDSPNSLIATQKFDVSDIPELFKKGEDVGFSTVSKTLNSLDRFIVVFLLLFMKRLNDLNKEKNIDGKSDIEFPEGADWHSLQKHPEKILQQAFKNFKVVRNIHPHGSHSDTSSLMIKSPELLDIGWEKIDLGTDNSQKQRKILNCFSELNLTKKQFSYEEITNLGTYLIENLLPDLIGEYWIPESLSKLMVKFAEELTASSNAGGGICIYDPHCGLGSNCFTAGADEWGYRLGNEANPKVLGILRLRLLLNNENDEISS